MTGDLASTVQAAFPFLPNTTQGERLLTLFKESDAVPRPLSHDTSINGWSKSPVRSSLILFPCFCSTGSDQQQFA